MNSNYLKSISLSQPTGDRMESYPFNIPAIRHIKTLSFESPVTFFVGENGSGKFTLLEAIAIALGFNPEGGSKNFNFSTEYTCSDLYEHLLLTKGYIRPRDGYFLRAESFYNVATHSPLLLAYPHSRIYSFSDTGISEMDYEDTEHYQITKYFMNNRSVMLKELLS